MTKSTTTSSSSVVVCSASLARRLAVSRFPTTSIGIVRRVRPSNQTVKDALQQGRGLDDAALSVHESDGSNQQVYQSSIVYKIVQEDGTERRMTNAEKKQVRLEAAKLKKERRKLEKQQEHDNSSTTSQLVDHEKYFQLDLDRKLMADELTELKGMRDGVPPVALGPACARQAAISGLLGGLEVTPIKVEFDVELSSRWALLLKQSMASAEQVRQAEDMRPMPYQLNPEAWTRLRPVFEEANKPTSSFVEDENSWSPVQLQAPTCPSAYNVAANAVVQLLYQAPELEVSCGAKFGSDFLLYQGAREDCHAFAGLRVECSESEDQLAVPSAYDLAGFVRGLNTAAKLPLLATVVVQGDLHRIAIVDLALEKIVVAGQNKRAGPELEKLRKKK